MLLYLLYSFYGTTDKPSRGGTVKSTRVLYELSTGSLKLPDKKHRDTEDNGLYLKRASYSTELPVLKLKENTMNETMKLMQKLSKEQKKAVRVHRIFTHAYFTSGDWMCIQLRHQLIEALPPKNRSKAWDVAGAIEDLNWKHWCDEAKAVGLR